MAVLVGRQECGRDARGPRVAVMVFSKVNIHKIMRWLGWLIAWAWTIVAGGGGLGLLITEGPWPPTNGWFALFSGLSACPLTAWLLTRYAGWKPSGYVRLGAAVLFIVAGRIALAIEGRPFLPHF
jgi:hypothetical protein